MSFNCSIAIQTLPKTDTHQQMITAIDAVIAHIKHVAAEHACNVCVSPFETVIEGDFEVLMQLIKSCQTVSLSTGAESVLSHIKIAYDVNGVMRIDEKINKHQ